MSATATQVQCDNCREPAAYRVPDGRPICETCARREAAFRGGGAVAGLDTLGFAVSILRRSGLTDQEIRRGLEANLAAECTEARYPADIEVAGNRDKEWRQTVTPLADVA